MCWYYSWLVGNRTASDLATRVSVLIVEGLYVPVSPWHYSSEWVVWDGLIGRAPTAFPDGWKQKGWSGAKGWCAVISPCWTIQCSLATLMWVVCVNKPTRVREREWKRERNRELSHRIDHDFSRVAQLLDLSHVYYYSLSTASRSVTCTIHSAITGMAALLMQFLLDCVNVHWRVTKYISLSRLSCLMQITTTLKQISSAC